MEEGSLLKPVFYPEILSDMFSSGKQSNNRRHLALDLQNKPNNQHQRKIVIDIIVTVSALINCTSAKLTNNNLELTFDCQRDTRKL